MCFVCADARDEPAVYRGDLHLWINDVAVDDPESPHAAEMPAVLVLLRQMHALAQALKESAPAFDWNRTQVGRGGGGDAVWAAGSLSGAWQTQITGTSILPRGS